MKRAVVAGAGCVVVAVVAVFLVDPRLDRQWFLRTMMLILALVCSAVLATGRRTLGLVGVALWGLIAPLATTAWSSPPEIDFARAVADDAVAKAQREASSVLSVDDIRAAARARGGVAYRPAPPPGSSGGRPGGSRLVVSPNPDPKAGPRACIWIGTGLEIRIRHRC